MVWAIPITAKHARITNPQEHLFANLRSRNMSVWLFVCVVLVKTSGFFFSYWPLNKNLILLLLSFLRLSLFRFQYYFIFFCIYFFLCFPHYYFLFLTLICVICGYVSLFLVCYFVFFFSSLHILYLLFAFMLVSFVIYLLIYLPGDTEKHNGKMHRKIRPFTHSLAKVVQYSRMLNIFHATSNLFLQPNWNFEICRYHVYLCNQLWSRKFLNELQRNYASWK
jgi:hypothetical protein